MSTDRKYFFQRQLMQQLDPVTSKGAEISLNYNDQFAQFLGKFLKMFTIALNTIASRIDPIEKYSMCLETISPTTTFIYNCNCYCKTFTKYPWDFNLTAYCDRISKAQTVLSNTAQTDMNLWNVLWMWPPTVKICPESPGH